MKRAFITHTGINEELLEKLIQSVDRNESFKLLFLFCREKDFSTLRRLLVERMGAQVLEVDENRVFYLIGDVRMQIEKVDYYL